MLSIHEEIEFVARQMRQEGLEVELSDQKSADHIKIGNRRVTADEYPEYFVSLNHLIKKYQGVEPEDIALYLIDFECF